MNAARRALPLILTISALSVCQFLTGGTRPVFSLPVYALLAVAALLAGRCKGPRVQGAGCLAATGVFFSYLLARAAFSPQPYLARADLLLMLGCLTVYLLTATVLVTARQRMFVVYALLVLGGGHTLVGVVQAAQGDDFMLFGFERAAMGSRASGLLISPNHLAGFLEIAGIMALSVAWWSGRKPAVKIFAGYAAACCYLGLLLSQSRGGVLCGVFSLLVWVGLTLRASYLGKPHRFDRALILGVGAVAVLFCIGGTVVATHNEMRERLATTLQRDIRGALWQAALEQFHQAPVFGTGAGTHLYLGRLFRRPEVQSDPIHAHNDYLELLAEYGLVGAVGMAVLLALHARRGWRALCAAARALRVTEEAGSDEMALTIGALGAFAAIAAHSMLDFNMHIPGNALVMALVFGLLARPALAEENAASATSVPPPERAARGLRLVLGGLLLAGSLLAWPGAFFTERARMLLRDEDEDEYPAVIASAAQGLRFDPWNPWTYFYLGEAHRLQAELEPVYADRQAHREDAARAFQQGLRLFPQDENLLVRHGQVLDRLRRFDEAEASYQAALAADPQLAILREFYEKHRTFRESAAPAAEQ